MPILSSPSAVVGSSTSTTTPAQGTNRMAMGKDEFLRLFVTRLQNQDPLSPMQDEDFVAQMAQFSSLEQLYNMNENLERALTANAQVSQSISNTMSTSLIGRTVRVATDHVLLPASGDTDIRFDLDKAAADITVEIHDDSGQLVRALRVDGGPAGANQVTWDGLDASGNRLPTGAYGIKIRAKDSDGQDVMANAYFSGTVDGVRFADGQALLAVNNVLIPLANVMEVVAEDE
ncbi:MAG: flagellar hook capping FlgD N-terminal domain-containing protein [Candidatus Zixiibacteriota bacterium]